MPFLNFIEMGSPCVLWLFLAGRGVSPHHARPPPQDCAGCRGRGFWTQAWPLWAPSPPPHSEDLASCPAICHPEPCGWRGQQRRAGWHPPHMGLTKWPHLPRPRPAPKMCGQEKSRKWGEHARRWAGFRWGQVGRVCAPAAAGMGDPDGWAGLLSQAVVGLGSAPGPRLGLCLAQAAMSGAGEVQRGTRGGWGGVPAALSWEGPGAPSLPGTSAPPVLSLMFCLGLTGPDRKSTRLNSSH